MSSPSMISFPRYVIFTKTKSLQRLAMRMSIFMSLLFSSFWIVAMSHFAGKKSLLISIPLALCFTTLLSVFLYPRMRYTTTIQKIVKLPFSHKGLPPSLYHANFISFPVVRSFFYSQVLIVFCDILTLGLFFFFFDIPSTPIWHILFFFRYGCFLLNIAVFGIFCWKQYPRNTLYTPQPLRG